VPHKERRVGGYRVADEPLGLVKEFTIKRALPLLNEWSGVLHPLRSVTVGPTMHHTALPKTELLDDLRVLRKVVLLGVLAGVQMVENPEELVETVHRRQVLVAIAQVVLAELAGRIAQRLEHLGQRRVLGLQTDLRPGQPDRRQPHPDRVLAGNEGRPTGRAGRFGIVIHEDHALIGNAVDVGRRTAHHAPVIRRDVPHPDVIAPDDQDVRTLGDCLIAHQRRLSHCYCTSVEMVRRDRRRGRRRFCSEPAAGAAPPARGRALTDPEGTSGGKGGAAACAVNGKPSCA